MGKPDTFEDVSVAAASPVAAQAAGTESGAWPADAVDPLPELDAVEQKAWRSFLVAHARVARRLEADLLARSHMPLAEFDVLMQLSLAEGQRLRMNELADRVLLSRAGITRLIDRLVADGLVARVRCASDARGAYAVLTEVAVSNPDKVYFPEAGLHQARSGRLLPGRGRWRAAWRGRPADGPQALRQRRRGRALLPEARPESRPDWIETVELSFPSGRTADEIVVRDAAQLAWIVNLGCIDLNPHPVRADDLDHPDELRVDLDPVPGVPWDDMRRVALVVREVLDDHGLRRLAQDVRARAASTSTCASSGAGRSTRCAARRWPSRARWSGARPDHRDQQVVEGGAPRRLPRLQPERQGPHRRLGLLGAADARRAGLDAADLGRGRHRAIPADFTLATVPARLRRARRPARRHRRRGRARSTRCSSCRRGRSAQGQGDAPWPPHYKKQPRRAAAGRSRRAPSGRRGRSAPQGKGQSRRRPSRPQPLIEIARAATRTTRSPASSAGRRATRGRGAARAGRRPGRLDARPLHAPGRASASTWSTSRRRSGRRRSRSIPTTTLGEAGRTRIPRRRAEDALELVGGRDLELVVAAVPGGLSGRQRRNWAPRGGSGRPACGRRRPRRRAPRRSGSQRQVLAAVPAAGRARAGAGPSRFFVRLRPIAPRVPLERVLAQRRELLDELAARSIVNAAVTPTWCSVPSSS